jgi:hypothetical protein
MLLVAHRHLSLTANNCFHDTDIQSDEDISGTVNLGLQLVKDNNIHSCRTPEENFFTLSYIVRSTFYVENFYFFLTGTAISHINPGLHLFQTVLNCSDVKEANYNLRETTACFTVLNMPRCHAIFTDVEHKTLLKH